MTTRLLLAVACAAAFCSTTAAAGPFDAFKGKMKEGMYEYKMNMEMPGMPAGMGKQAHTLQKCVTAKDIDEGAIGKAPNDRKASDRCEVKDMKQSGNTATYTMACKDDKGAPAMVVDNKITFSNDNFNMEMNMAMNQGPAGQPIKMKQTIEGRYLGPCK